MATIVISGVPFDTGVLQDPKRVGYRKLYPASKMGTIETYNAVLSDMFMVMGLVLREAGFIVTEGVKTTDAEYRFLDITTQTITGIDAPKYALFLSNATDNILLPYLYGYYGDDLLTATTYCGIGTFDGIKPSVDRWQLTTDNIFLQDNDVELTVVADGQQGVWWYCLSHIVGGTKLAYMIQMATYYNRLPIDTTTPEQTSVKYGVVDLGGVFSTSYGLMFSIDSGVPMAWDVNYGVTYAVDSLICGMGDFVAPYNGLSTYLISQGYTSPNLTAWGTGYQVNVPTIMGPLQGFRVVLATDTLAQWSVVTDEYDSFLVVRDDFYASQTSGTGAGLGDTYAFTCPSEFTQLSDYV